MYKNYSINRNFNFGRFKEDFEIRVVRVIEKAKSNQLRVQSHDEVTYLACVLRAYPELLYEDLLPGIWSLVIEVIMIRAMIQ